jgi:hypothetical protein
MVVHIIVAPWLVWSVKWAANWAAARLTIASGTRAGICSRRGGGLSALQGPYRATKKAGVTMADK